MPILLNKNSDFFKAFKSMSDAKVKLGVMVSERGDSKAGFHYEALDFIVTDDGLMLIELPHLTVVNPAKAVAADDDSPYYRSDESDCFVGSLAQGGSFAGLAALLLGLLGALGIRTRNN